MRDKISEKVSPPAIVTMFAISETVPITMRHFASPQRALTPLGFFENLIALTPRRAMSRFENADKANAITKTAIIMFTIVASASASISALSEPLNIGKLLMMRMAVLVTAKKIRANPVSGKDKILLSSLLFIFLTSV